MTVRCRPGDAPVWVTDRMNSKEDELSELQEQIEKYQSLLEITSVASGKAKAAADSESASMRKLHGLAFGAALFSLASVRCGW